MVDLSMAGSGHQPPAQLVLEKLVALKLNMYDYAHFTFDLAVLRLYGATDNYHGTYVNRLHHRSREVLGGMTTVLWLLREWHRAGMCSEAMINLMNKLMGLQGAGWDPADLEVFNHIDVVRLELLHLGVLPPPPTNNYFLSR
jgi:hypothetical protein